MNETLIMIFSAIAGIVLGAIFFGGLWWTVRRGVQSPRPALWFLGSAVVRLGITLGGFYLVGAGQWQRFAACLVGFLIGRLMVTWITRLKPEEHHAP